jgi:hypothetical protein
MSQQYAEWLAVHGVRHVAHVPMGFDAYRCRPRLVLGVFGLLDAPRKGRALVDRVRGLPFVEVLTTEGKVAADGLAELYQRVDYVLIPAAVEGGPMALLEGLGSGKPVIAPAGVGMVPEFGDTEHIRRYPAGDADALVRLITSSFEEKLGRRQLVEDRTWDQWAEAHLRVFTDLLRTRGRPVPQPAPGFRFTMMAELDIPPGMPAADLETVMDIAAAHLFHGRYAQARAALAEAARRHREATAPALAPVGAWSRPVRTGWPRGGPVREGAGQWAGPGPGRRRRGCLSRSPMGMGDVSRQRPCAHASVKQRREGD